MRSVLKSLTKWALRLPGATIPFRPLLRGRAAVFMLHRFRQPDHGAAGHDPEALRSVLAHLRRERYELVDLEELVRRLAGDGPPPRRAVAFSIDDGYADQAEVGAPVFREFDCPVTTFVTSGFLDGRLWFWWDRIEYVFRKTCKPSLSLPFQEGAQTRLGSDTERIEAQNAFTVWCKQVPDARKHEAIAALATQAEVDLPRQAPQEYRPMSWNQVRRCEDGGMRFGPHTDTHPILTQVPDEQAKEEIERSWARLRQEAQDPTPVFCYPNGQAGDYGAREQKILRQGGFYAAVVGTPGYVSRSRLREAERAFFELPRFSYTPDRGTFVRYASGLEQLMTLLRGGVS